MAELSFNTGLQTFSLNGAIEVSFNATDSAFIERLYLAFERLEKRQAEYEAIVQSIKNKADIFDFMRDRDSEMRSEIDSLFDANVCEVVFGRMNVFALADGLPVWCNLMLAIMEKIDDSFSKEQTAVNPRMDKYLKKYNKK